MKITDTADYIQQQQTGQSRKSEDGKRPFSRENGHNLDSTNGSEVILSAAAKEIIASEPAVRKGKVAELKERVISGRYVINHEEVADKISRLISIHELNLCRSK
jgi:flagellar biosynthesis anti-sigma factor FlgM